MGLDSLVRAMALLPPEVHLTIGGEGPLKSELRALAQQLNLSHRVRLAGHIPDDKLPGFYCSADWFVLPTAALEGFGLVILESLACGTPVLGTRVGAIPDVLGQFDPAWIIEHSTPESIAATVKRAMGTRRPDRLQLHDRVAAKFSWDRIGQLYAALLESLIQK